jgi:hypothetical protein
MMKLAATYLIIDLINDLITDGAVGLILYEDFGHK